MKCIVPGFLLCFLLWSGKAHSQRLTINEKDCSPKIIFNKIEEQTGYTFIYSEDVYKNAIPVTINVKNATLKDVLLICQTGQPFVFEVDYTNKKIWLKTSADQNINRHSPASPFIAITGKVVNERDEPLEAVTVKIGGLSRSQITAYSISKYTTDSDVNYTSLGVL
jgi:iron complex outermembrane receptor protein